MAMYISCATLLLAVSALMTMSSAQTVVPSNDTTQIPSYDSYPRFWINGTDFDSFRVVPVGWYGQISQQAFQRISVQGRLIAINDQNANSLIADGIDYISCDPADYTGNLAAADVLRIVTASQPGNSIVLYSTSASHCESGNLQNIGAANGIFTTLDPVLAATVRSQILSSTSGLPASVSPDTNSFTNGTGNNRNQPFSNSSHNTSGPTTAVAMIILYTITGLITALFVVIIVTGAIRAHRHPERYGPSNVAGRPRRTRAKGIARAMLDTIPIVKFGDKDESPKKEVDIEMNSTGAAETRAQSKAVSTEVNGADEDSVASGAIAKGTANADGTDDAGQLGCSICTEDFTKGEEVRVLPCNHKFHPDCVDPWLLNVSGTCPLCRIDLRPKEEQNQAAEEAEDSTLTPGATAPPRRSSIMDIMAPPLGHLPIRMDLQQARASHASRRDTVTFASLRSVAAGSREDRIAALRRFRQQRVDRAAQGESAEQEAERRGLSTRLRDRFRIRTRRQGEEEASSAAFHASAHVSH